MNTITVCVKRNAINPSEYTRKWKSAMAKWHRRGFNKLYIKDRNLSLMKSFETPNRIKSRLIRGIIHPINGFLSAWSQSKPWIYNSWAPPWEENPHKIESYPELKAPQIPTHNWFLVPAEPGGHHSLHRPRNEPTRISPKLPQINQVLSRRK